MVISLGCLCGELYIGRVTKDKVFAQANDVKLSTCELLVRPDSISSRSPVHLRSGGLRRQEGSGSVETSSHDLSKRGNCFNVGNTVARFVLTEQLPK